MYVIICAHLNELIQSQFMLDPKMWSEAPFGGCDAIAEPSKACRGQIKLRSTSQCGGTMRRALCSSTLTWLVDARWGRYILYKHKLTSLTTALLCDAHKIMNALTSAEAISPETDVRLTMPEMHNALPECSLSHQCVHIPCFVTSLCELFAFWLLVSINSPWHISAVLHLPVNSYHF